MHAYVKLIKVHQKLMDPFSFQAQMGSSILSRANNWTSAFAHPIFFCHDLQGCSALINTRYIPSDNLGMVNRLLHKLFVHGHILLNWHLQCLQFHGHVQLRKSPYRPAWADCQMKCINRSPQGCDKAQRQQQDDEHDQYDRHTFITNLKIRSYRFK